MLAKDVYKAHKNRIHRIAEKTRRYKTGAIPQDKVFDKNGNIDILFTGSDLPAPDIYERLNQITYELRGIHTHCRIIPQGKNIHMICTETNKEDVIALKECLNPIKDQVAKGISNFARELLEQKNMQEKLNATTPLLDILEYFDRYKRENCKPTEKKQSEITVANDTS